MEQDQTGSPSCLIAIFLRGGRLVDDVMLDLLDRGLDQAVVLDSQSLSEAISHEVPLFVDFRDLFGDPTGSRLVLLEARRDQEGLVAEVLRSACARHPQSRARLAILPLLATQRFGGGAGGRKAGLP